MRWGSGEIPRSTVAVGSYGRDRVSRRVESGRRRRPNGATSPQLRSGSFLLTGDLKNAFSDLLSETR